MERMAQPRLALAAISLASSWMLLYRRSLLEEVLVAREANAEMVGCFVSQHPRVDTQRERVYCAHTSFGESLLRATHAASHQSR